MLGELIDCLPADEVKTLRYHIKSLHQCNCEGGRFISAEAQPQDMFMMKFPMKPRGDGSGEFDYAPSISLAGLLKYNMEYTGGQCADCGVPWECIDRALFDGGDRQLLYINLHRFHNAGVNFGHGRPSTIRREMVPTRIIDFNSDNATMFGEHWKLIGAIEHVSGDCKSGHFKCWRRREAGGWWVIDDHNVTQARKLKDYLKSYTVLLLERLPRAPPQIWDGVEWESEILDEQQWKPMRAEPHSMIGQPPWKPMPRRRPPTGRSFLVGWFLEGNFAPPRFHAVNFL